MNYYEPNPCYDSNYSGFDQLESPQQPVIHQSPQETTKEVLQARDDQLKSTKTFLKEFNSLSFRETPKVLLLAWEKCFEIKHACKEKQLQPDDIQELLHKLLNDVQIISEELAEYINLLSWNRRAYYYEDDDEEYTITITPDEVLDDIISIPPRNGNDHFNAESSPIESVLNRDNVISSPKIDLLIEEFAGELALIAPIPLGIVEANLDPKEDIRFIENLMYDNSFPRPPKTLKDDSETVIDSNNDYTSSDDDSYEDIDYVDASPPDSELVSLGEVKDFHPEDGEIEDDILREKLSKINLLIAKIKALKDNPTPSSDFVTKSSSTSLNFFLKETNTFNNSLPESETFCFNLEEISSGSPTSYSDLSLPDYEAFFYDSEPDSGNFTMDVIPLKVQSKRFLSPNEFSISFMRDPLSLVFNTLLPFSSENEDKVFNPGILASNEETSPHLLSHRGFNPSKIIFDFSESPMMIFGGDIPILDVLFLHFYPP
ncbi:hypothetical protein Tco_1223616 [Tanacetum coccineum]